jgi:hypothetical protein
MKSKFIFWYEVELLDPIFKSAYFMILGGIITILFLNLVYYLLLGSYILNDWPVFLIPIVMFISQIPIFYFASQFRKKKFGGEILKHFRGKKPEIDEYVRKALDSLNLKYETESMGSKWTAIIPYYKVHGYDIMVKVTQAYYRDVVVATKTQNPEDIPKAKEIERAIDSHLSTLSIKNIT